MQKQATFTQWSGTGRSLVFLLASTSIWCLLADFYELCPMRTFAIYILGPATLFLITLAVLAGMRGDWKLWRGIWIGSVAGFLAACAYDIFRLPFVFAVPLGIDTVVPSMKLFKVFPRFGAMLLGEPIEQPFYTLTAHLLGWAYHFSNGITFGIMYTALIGNGSRRSWWWAVLFAMLLEMAMLLTPYPRVFGIHITFRFIIVTLAAHAIFGVGLGLLVRRLYRAPAIVV